MKKIILMSMIVALPLQAMRFPNVPPRIKFPTHWKGYVAALTVALPTVAALTVLEFKREPFPAPVTTESAPSSSTNSQIVKFLLEECGAPRLGAL